MIARPRTAAVLVALAAVLSGAVGSAAPAATKTTAKPKAAAAAKTKKTTTTTRSSTTKATTTSAAPTSTVAGGPVPRPAGTLRFTSCSDRIECAFLPVPVDDPKTTGPTIDLAVSRLPATDPAQRLGVLVVDDGGPGTSPQDWLNTKAATLPAPVLARFDLVAFDPRGMPKSDEITCGSLLDGAADPLLRRQIAESCRNMAGGRLSHLDTATTARDLERLRVALGEPQISFLGYSYASVLGIAYAQAYPSRVRAMVLDSPVDPGTTAVQRVVDRLAARERTLDAFLAWCADPANRCAFDDRTDLPARYAKVAAAVQATPVRTTDGTPIDRTLFEDVVESLLLDDSRWRTLGDFLARLVAGRSSSFADVRAAARSAQEPSLPASGVVLLGTSCADGFYPSWQPDIDALATTAAQVAPRFTTRVPVLTGAGACTIWPVAPRPRAAATKLPVPSVVLSAALDLVTPREWAVKLAGDTGAAMITTPGARHGIFRQVPCANDAVAAYLLDPATAARSLAC